MRLNLFQRLIVLNTLLIQNGTMNDVRISKSLKEKVKTTEDESLIVSENINQESGSISESAITNEEKEFEISDEDALFLRNRIDFLDKNGLVQEGAYETYIKILAETSPANINSGEDTSETQE